MPFKRAIFKFKKLPLGGIFQRNQPSIQTSNSTGLSTKERMCLKPYVGTQTVLGSVLKQGFFVLHNKQRQQSLHCVFTHVQYTQTDTNSQETLTNGTIGKK